MIRQAVTAVARPRIRAAAVGTDRIGAVVVGLTGRITLVVVVPSLGQVADPAPRLALDRGSRRVRAALTAATALGPFVRRALAPSTGFASRLRAVLPFSKIGGKRLRESSSAAGDIATGGVARLDSRLKA